MGVCSLEQKILVAVPLSSRPPPFSCDIAGASAVLYSSLHGTSPVTSPPNGGLHANDIKEGGMYWYRDARDSVEKQVEYTYVCACVRVCVCLCVCLCVYIYIY